MGAGGELVRSCAAGDHAGWERLWGIVAESAAVPIRRLLSRYRIDPDLADDLLQEFFLHLQGDATPMGRFRGDGEDQLRGYLRVLAERFALDRLARLRREAAREDRAARAWAHAERDDRPPESRFLAALAEFERLLDNVGRGRLRVLLDPEAAAGVPGRTLRLWAEALARRLAEAMP